ncbi:MAG: protein translocase subunit SecF [Bacillota bacterium]
MKKFSDIKLNLRNMKVFENAYYWFIAPLAIIFIAMVCGTVYTISDNYDGFANIGIDFKAGTVLTVEMDEALVSDFDATADFIEDIIENDFGAIISVRQTSGTTAIVLRYANSINGTDYSTDEMAESMVTINQQICDAVELAFYNTYNVNVSADAEMTSASASTSLVQSALLAVSIAMVLMLLYVIFRFDLYSGIATICAQLHDIIIMLSLVVIFRIQIGSTLIAGIITIVAYAINNTIVVFDRVRENTVPFKNKNKALDPRLIVNNAVSFSIKRSMFTSLTTFITISILACFGVSTLTEFALPIMFGIVAGFYSSTFLAPSIWGLMIQHKNGKARKAKRESNKK